MVAGGCWEESPEQAVTTLFLETLFLLAARYVQGGRAGRLHKKKVLGPLGALSSSLKYRSCEGLHLAGYASSIPT